MTNISVKNVKYQIHTSVDYGSVSKISKIYSISNRYFLKSPPINAFLTMNQGIKVTCPLHIGGYKFVEYNSDDEHLSKKCKISNQY